MEIFDDSLVYKRWGRVERIQDLVHIPSKIKGIQQKIMHYLSNLNFVMESEVRVMSTDKFFQWSKLVETMRVWSNNEKCEFVGVTNITHQETSWKKKAQAMLAILNSLCILIKEEQPDSFFCLYWAMKAYGQICMDFKDLEAAHKVFSRLKKECEKNMMYKHKMVIYK